MQADAIVFAIGFLIVLVVGCVVLLGVAKCALTSGRPFDVEFRLRGLFSFRIKSMRAEDGPGDGAQDPQGVAISTTRGEQGPMM